MTGPILAFLFLFFVQTTLEVSVKLAQSGWTPKEQVRWGLSARDVPPPATPQSERAARALKNLIESTPAFLALSLLHEMQTPDPWAPTLAWAFIGLRVAYLPAYLAGVTGVRSTIWTLGGVCLVALAVLLLV